MAKSKFKYFRMDAKKTLTDPLLSTLKMTGAWTNLLALCKVCNTSGAYIDDVDCIMDLKSIAKRAKLSMKVLNYFISCERIVKNSKGEFCIKNWDKYQDFYDRRYPELKQKPPEDSAPRKKEGEPNEMKSNLIPISPEKPAPTPTLSASPQAVFVDWFKAEFKTRFGKPYADDKADYIQATRVIKAYQNDIELLKRLVQRAWNTPDQKDFSIASVSMTVKGFCSVVNRIQLQKPKPKTAYEIEQEQANAEQF